MAKPSAKPRAPIWARPAPGTRRPRLTREQIAQTALAIADAEGFAAVSMRRVATALDAGTMTLYYYVKTKDELIALMDDAIMAEVVLPADQLPPGWRAGLTAIAHATRAAFVRHPWALYSLQGARIGGPNGMRHMEQTLAALDTAPLDVQGKLRALSIVDDYVFGHVLRVSEAWVHPVDHKVVASITAFFQAQLATGAYPHLSEMLGGDVLTSFSRIAHWLVEDTRFDAGLAALLDGLELQMRAAPPLSSPVPALAVASDARAEPPRRRVTGAAPRAASPARIADDTRVVASRAVRRAPRRRAPTGQ